MPLFPVLFLFSITGGCYFSVDSIDSIQIVIPGSKCSCFIPVPTKNHRSILVKVKSTKCTKILVEHKLRNDQDSLDQLEDLLDPKLSDAGIIASAVF